MSVLPTKAPTFKVYRGDDFMKEFIFKDPATNQPLNLETEGWGTWEAKWRPHLDSVEYIDFLVDETEKQSGVISISLSPEKTRLLKDGVWDLQSSNSTIIKTWVFGKIEVLKDVTHD